jgi:D-alanyl-lipoteichoic acid acyltransferase DltB (MBOAT superfamily)
MGVLAFSGQIFFDFAGYSTCAIGAAMCLGFWLPQNFLYPYAAIGFSDFWRRWHITLSLWLRDYLYIPLGGNRRGNVKTYINLMITMLLGGLWHGASWTFVVWGGLHGFYLWVEKFLRDKFGKKSTQIDAVGIPTRTIQSGENPTLPVSGTTGMGIPARTIQSGENPMPPVSGTDGNPTPPVSSASVTPAPNKRIAMGFIYALLTFFLVNVTWVFFRAQTFTKAWDMLKSMFGFIDKANPMLTTLAIIKVSVIITLTVLVSWYMRERRILVLAHKVHWTVVGICWAVLVLLLILSQESASSFIYFQF